MIQKIMAFKTDDGLTHASVELAKDHEMRLLFDKCTGLTEPNTAAAFVLNNADHVKDILTMKANSKPAARKINGGTKVRKPKPTTTPAPQAA